MSPIFGTARITAGIDRIVVEIDDDPLETIVCRDEVVTVAADGSLAVDLRALDAVLTVHGWERWRSRVTVVSGSTVLVDVVEAEL